jgi:hypothetical protein
MRCHVEDARSGMSRARLPHCPSDGSSMDGSVASLSSGHWFTRVGLHSAVTVGPVVEGLVGGVVGSVGPGAVVSVVPLPGGVVVVGSTVGSVPGEELALEGGEVVAVVTVEPRGPDRLITSSGSSPPPQPTPPMTRAINSPTPKRRVAPGSRCRHSGCLAMSFATNRPLLWPSTCFVDLAALPSHPHGHLALLRCRPQGG